MFWQSFHQPIRLSAMYWHLVIYTALFYCSVFQFVIVMLDVAVVLMGKNTMMRKAIKGHLDNNPGLEK